MSRAVPDNAWQEYGAPGSGMHRDFVLADPVRLEVGLVIELDDKSHSGIEAQKRDALKDAALKAAGVPLLRVRVAGRYNTGDLKARIAATLFSAGLS
jgi:very-short-patch-repair endonuclease